MSKINKSKPKVRTNVVNTRKALRKQKRLEKKVHRKEHYLKKKTAPEKPSYTPGKFVKRPADAADFQKEVETKKLKLQPSIQEVINKDRQKERKEVNRLKSQMEEQRREMLLKANDEEDKVIKKLEKQLGLNKSKNKTKNFANDGLDYLLEICDRTTSEQIVAAEKHLADVNGDSDFEEDLAVVTGKDIKKNMKKSSNHEDDEQDIYSDDGASGEDNDDLSISGDDDDIFENEIGSDNDIDSGDETGSEFDEGKSSETEEIPIKADKSSKQESKLKEKKTKETENKERIISEEDLDKVFSDDEISHLSDDDSEREGEKNDDKSGKTEKEEKPDVWEDIYGRKRDRDGNVIKESGVYVPPHLRNKDSISDKDLTQLKRQIKSILNKLAGTNLHWACNSIETLYSSNSRNSVNSVLFSLWCEATLAQTATPDRLLAEHAALVAVLHANVATDIGAFFLQELCKKFDSMIATPQPVENKTLDNLISCLSHLYSFKIYHASLLYDILARLLHELTEKNIECIVVALRCVGGVMRKEEPAALKNFIHDTQAKVAGMNETAQNGSRVKFLLEVLLAVKNNNLMKIPKYDPTYTEYLKKHIKTVIRKGNYVTPLNIRLEDLLKADERGRWWVVGSAWEGKTHQEEKPAVKQTPSTDQKLLELARKQRMNTDVRRSIFCVIMSAEDYMDAFEKLHHLNLRGQQEREVIHVLIACCLQEKAYNMYYSLLAEKLCSTDRKYQLSIQFSVWDKIKDIENMSKQSLTNLAQFLIHLIMEKALPLSVLKIIEFSDLNKSTVRLMRQILLAIIMNENLPSSLEVFHRISKSPKLHMFRESIRLFIQHFLIKNAGKKVSVLSEEEMATLKERTLEVNRILTMYDSKLRL